MKQFIELFDKLYHEVIIQNNMCLVDMEKIEYRKFNYEGYPYCYEYFLNGNIENYLKVYENKGKYMVCTQHRNSESTFCEYKSVEYAVAVLFFLFANWATNVKDSEHALKFREEDDNENNDAMKKLLVERFGHLISFGENVYDKISLLATSENNLQPYYDKVYYHNKEVSSIISCVHYPKDRERIAYIVAYNSSIYIENFYKIMKQLKKIVPLNDEAENSKLEFLFVSGKNEDQIT